MGKTIEAESTPVETASVALQETDQPAFDPDNLDRDTSPTKLSSPKADPRRSGKLRCGCGKRVNLR